MHQRTKNEKIMFGFLGFLLLFLLLIIFIGFFILGNILRALFGIGRRTPTHYHGDPSQDDATASPDGSSTKKKKIFGDDEGEYVDYEEIK